MKKIMLIILCFAFLLNSCITNRIICEKGSGNIDKYEVNLTNFNVVNLRNSAKIFITQGEDEKIVIETDDNIYPYLITETQEGELILDNEKSICPQKLNYYITMKDIKGFKVLGSGNIVAKTPLLSDNLFIKISGSGDIKFDTINVLKFGVKIFGSGDVKVKGIAERFASEINGSGNILARDLKCDYANIETNGSGDVRLDVSKELKVEINGSGYVFYYGNPSNINIRTRGSGKVRDMK